MHNITQDRYKVDIDNKELLSEAIKDYEKYNNSQKKLLIALVNITIDGVITTSILSLSKLIGFTRTMVYNSLAALEEDGSVKKINIKQARVSTFELNYVKLKYIVELYLKKQEFLNSKRGKQS